MGYHNDIGVDLIVNFVELGVSTVITPVRLVVNELIVFVVV